MNRSCATITALVCFATLCKSASGQTPPGDPPPTAPVTTSSPDANHVLVTKAPGDVATITGQVTQWPNGKPPTYVQVTITFPGVGTIYNGDFGCDATGNFSGTMSVPPNGGGTIELKPIYGGTLQGDGSWRGGMAIGAATTNEVNVQRPPTPGGGGGT